MSRPLEGVKGTAPEANSTRKGSEHRLLKRQSDYTVQPGKEKS